MATSKPHLCNPSYDNTGTCKFCKSKPCVCEEASKKGFLVVREKIFFSRPADPIRAQLGAQDSGSYRGSWKPRSQWGYESVMRSMFDLLKKMPPEVETEDEKLAAAHSLKQAKGRSK